MYQRKLKMGKNESPSLFTSRKPYWTYRGRQYRTMFDRMYVPLNETYTLVFSWILRTSVAQPGIEHLCELHMKANEPKKIECYVPFSCKFYKISKPRAVPYNTVVQTMIPGGWMNFVLSGATTTNAKWNKKWKSPSCEKSTPRASKMRQKPKSTCELALSQAILILPRITPFSDLSHCRTFWKMG